MNITTKHQIALQNIQVSIYTLVSLTKCLICIRLKIKISNENMACGNKGHLVRQSDYVAMRRQRSLYSGKQDRNGQKLNS